MPARFPRSAGQTWWIASPRGRGRAPGAAPLVPFKALHRLQILTRYLWPRFVATIGQDDGHGACDPDRCSRRRRWKNNCECKGGLSASLIMPQPPGGAGLPLASRPATAAWARPASRFPRRVSPRVPRVQLAGQAPPSPAALSRSPTRPASFSQPPHPRLSQCRQACHQDQRGTLPLPRRIDSGRCSCKPGAQIASRGVGRHRRVRPERRHRRRP